MDNEHTCPVCGEQLLFGVEPGEEWGCTPRVCFTLACKDRTHAYTSLSWKGFVSSRNFARIAEDLMSDILEEHSFREEVKA